MQIISLQNDFLCASVLPAVGGGLARLDWRDGMRPVLRPVTSAQPTADDLACFPLLPWSNRIGGGGFEWDGRRVPVAPNRAGERDPIHGDGWQQPWQIAAQSATALSLTLDWRHGAPFSYQAQMRYALQGAALLVTLDLRNTGLHALPFGLGLHPWLPRSEGVLLQAQAQQVWRSGADHLPLDPMPMPPQWDFSRPQALPLDAIDHVFSGWDGQAEIVWPERGLRLQIGADMAHYIVYAPVGADFFCFEPVDHLINAHNMPDGAVQHGLTRLAPQQALQRQIRFTVRAHG